METISDRSAALVIGASDAGIQAAMDLADSGVRVHLLEKSPFIGSSAGRRVPEHLWQTRLLEVVKHPRITLWTQTSLKSAEKVDGICRLVLERRPRFVDLAKCTNCGECVAACPVDVADSSHRAAFCRENLQPGCAVIAKTVQPPCSGACPAGIKVQGYVSLLAKKRYREALDLILEAMPFPGICGRVCSRPCEASCRRHEVDKPVAIRALKRFLSDNERGRGVKTGAPAAPCAGPSGNGDKVAVIGSGPAGLTAAYQLARKRYRVTVFEKLPVAGGMMAVGIPSYRLPRDILQADIETVRQAGVTIRTGVTFGEEISLASLSRDGFRAMVLATGLHRGISLGIEGEALGGVVDGIALLRRVALKKEAAIGKNVVIVGGGNVAIDCAQTCLRLGAENVRVLYRRTRAEMPAWEEEIEDAETLGVGFVFLAAPVRVVGEAGRVQCLVAMRMKLGAADASGRRRPMPLPDSEFTLAADTVVVAIGQAPDLDLLTRFGVEADRRGLIVVEPRGPATSRAGVFAAGDAVYGPRTVVEAIAAGNETADRIHRYLRGLQDRQSDPAGSKGYGPGIGGTGHRHTHVSEGCAHPLASERLEPLTAAQRQTLPPAEMPVLCVPDRQKGFAEVMLGLSEPDALYEAARCLSCGPCGECLACVRACTAGAICHDQKPVLLGLEVGAILHAGGAEPLDGREAAGLDWPIRVDPGDPLGGSSAAGQTMAQLPVALLTGGPDPAPESCQPVLEVGVFICECGRAIGEILDTGTIAGLVGKLPDVAMVQVLSVSCTPESGEAIRTLAAENRLTQVVLAACSCCELDQVCHSCTYQRIRCKKSVRPVDSPSAREMTPDPSPGRVPDVPVEFINIRETCAWAHADHPELATQKAVAMISAAVAKCRHRAVRTVRQVSRLRSVLIAGGGASGDHCLDILRRRQIAVHQVTRAPKQIRRSGGAYRTHLNDRLWETDAVVLAPKDADETPQLIGAFGPGSRQPRIHTRWGGISTHRPGVFICDPSGDSRVVGRAAAARACAWIGRGSRIDRATAAVVDTHRCRTCRTCIDICEFGAPEISDAPPFRSAWIDARICRGCGTCAAHCPSGAITAGCHSDEQLAAVLQSGLRSGGNE